MIARRKNMSGFFIGSACRTLRKDWCVYQAATLGSSGIIKTLSFLFSV
jgi:hypothetical protein